MLNNFISCLTLIAGLLFAVALEYGFDKEETRQVYLQYVENQDFEKTITGCKFKSNCDYYNNLLWTAVEQGDYKMTDLKYNYSDIVYKNDNFFAIKDEKKGGFWICTENGLYADVLGFTSYFDDIEQLIKFVQSLRND